ncbi:MAG: molybdopterin biosynthesis protein [Anaerolineales bacterium]|nr:molybdopterin biosynthesis protein [Anaerolineales bacterium]
MSENRSRNKIYLEDIPLQDAWASFIETLEEAGLWEPLGIEEILVQEALGRITAEPIWADISSPHYHSSAMDGYAIRAVDTAGANDRSPVTLEIGTQALYVDTGDPIPEWSNAVVPIENVEPVGKTEQGRAVEAICIRAPLSPWNHVRSMGEDMVATELVLPSGHILRPVDLGAIAGSGHTTVQVWRKPRVTIIPTGSELIPPSPDAAPGEILEYNSLVLGAQVESWGGVPIRRPIIPDDFDRICSEVTKVVEDSDLILIIAGSSAGSEDHTAKVVTSLGTLLVHGVAVRPGHPVILGVIQASEESSSGGSPRAVPVVGVPGYPVSAALTGEIFVEPLLAQWLGRQKQKPPTMRAIMTRKIHSSLGDDEFLRVTVGQVGDRLVAAPLSRGAGVITSLVRADGLVRIPSGAQGIHAGEEVEVDLYRDPEEIRKTILVLGSHDLTLDLIAQHLALRGARLASANLGSLGGLFALQRKEAHLAGSHLLDPESGEYNLRYVEEYLSDLSLIILALVNREQGLILQSGNPNGIQKLEDLSHKPLSFVNRQRGSGTRLLLDYHLERLGIPTDEVQGYDQEEYTHLAVSAAVASGRADCGLGIRAAAAALNLDFIPLFNERYDLIIPLEHYTSPKLVPLLEVLEDPIFRSTVDSRPGYDASVMGKIIAKIEH